MNYIMIMPIFNYPHFSPLELDMKPILHPWFLSLEEGISEYTFAGLYLFRNTYQYQIAWLPEENDPKQRRKLVLRGMRDGKSFYAFPAGLPSDFGLRKAMLQEVDYIKGLAENFADPMRVWAEQQGHFVWEDRDNFDYLYLRQDLATLEGKKYHKKRNHVNSFVANYQYEERKFCSQTMPDAYRILDAWHAERGRDDDYAASLEALDKCVELELCGYMVYADGQPAGYTMGEGIQNGKTFVVHIEKASSQFKGIYQFINMGFASVLPENYQYINREQDLGNPGLRQAKMTYLPCCFVKKYRIYPIGAELPQTSAAQEIAPALAIGQ